MADVDAQKRLKALNKKLGQISKLKEKKDQLTAEEKEKVAGESNILNEIRALERGEPVAEVKAKAPSPAKEAVAEAVEEASPVFETPVAGGASPQQPVFETEPASPVGEAAEAAEEAVEEAAEKPQVEPAEAEKRIKALKKKLAQIAKLQEKKDLSAEEQEKVSRGPGMEAEIQELELGLLEPEARKRAVDLQKKLDQVRKLESKSKGGLTAPEREKISKGPAMQKELQGILGR